MGYMVLSAKVKWLEFRGTYQPGNGAQARINILNFLFPGLELDEFLKQSIRYVTFVNINKPMWLLRVSRR